MKYIYKTIYISYLQNNDMDKILEKELKPLTDKGYKILSCSPVNFTKAGINIEVSEFLVILEKDGEE